MREGAVRIPRLGMEAWSFAQPPCLRMTFCLDRDAGMEYHNVIE